MNRSPGPQSSPKLWQLAAQIWMLLIIAGFLWIRVLDSGLVQHLYARLRPH
jgi:hypothetical protein